MRDRNKSAYSSLREAAEDCAGVCASGFVYPHGAVEIENLKNSVTVKVNGQRIKPYMEYQPREASTKINLSDPPNLD